MTKLIKGKPIHTILLNHKSLIHHSFHSIHPIDTYTPRTLHPHTNPIHTILLSHYLAYNHPPCISVFSKVDESYMLPLTAFIPFK